MGTCMTLGDHRWMAVIELGRVVIGRGGRPWIDHFVWKVIEGQPPRCEGMTGLRRATRRAGRPGQGDRRHRVGEAAGRPAACVAAAYRGGGGVVRVAA